MHNALGAANLLSMLPLVKHAFKTPQTAKPLLVPNHTPATLHVRLNRTLAEHNKRGGYCATLAITSNSPLVMMTMTPLKMLITCYL